MPPPPSWYCLGNDYKGTIENTRAQPKKVVHIVWEDKAIERISKYVKYHPVSLETIKALTEHFLYQGAIQLGYSHVKIM